jgi:2-polyprenyl-6-methoxyphenol hydroxylase-like FAD-dependent oxidoreductase
LPTIVVQYRATTDTQARGIAIHYGARFESCAERDKRVVAHFAEGHTAEGDFLIGADGIHSRVRAAIAPEATPPQYTGLLNIGGIVRGTTLPATPDTMEMVWGRRAFFGYTIRPNGDAWWFANLGQPEEPGRHELAAITTLEWQRRLHPLFAADPPFIRSLIDQTGTIEATPIHDLPTLPRWHRGRIGLLGDAAHAVSPSAGQGASLAMEDALMLAHCLREARAPQPALARYEQARRSRAERIVAEGRRRGTSKALENDAAVFLRDLIMPLALRVFASPKAMAWITDYTIPWETPATVASA